MARSLRLELLTWVALPLSAAVAVLAVFDYQNASATATVVQDRLLLGSAHIIAEQLHFEDGGLQAHIPPSALELFQSGPQDRVYYRVTTEAGQLLSGYAELALPVVALQPEQPHFFDSAVRGLPVRAVALLQPVPGAPGAQAVTVEIAQTLSGHAQLTHSLWLNAVGQQMLILALAAMLALLGLRRGLRPVLQLRDTVLARPPGALAPLALAGIPQELTPLVEAINDHAVRLARHNDAQQVFIQDAAHQLRTPFTLLNTQISYALRSPDEASRMESLRALRRSVQQSVRLVNQLLTLSSAEVHSVSIQPATALRLDSVVQRALEDLSALAQAKQIDLGFEQLGPPPSVLAQPVALREIVVNLVHNAIVYTQPGGVVTARIDCAADAPSLTVEDNGPGIAPEQRERVFERFYRIADHDSRGCGLGLPIVREFARRMGATVQLSSAGGPSGLQARVQFPASTKTPCIPEVDRQH